VAINERTYTTCVVNYTAFGTSAQDGGSEDEVVIDEDASESEEDGSDDDRSLSEQGLSEEEKDDSDGSLENEDYDTDKVQGEGTDPDHDDDDHEDDEDGHQDEEEGAGGKQERVRGKKKKVRGVLSRDELQTFKDRAEQTGVIYISRIPPFMKPIKLRHYFSAYGTVGRIYLQAEGMCIAGTLGAVQCIAARPDTS
jgi:ESF2/ABP1 family protein